MLTKSENKNNKPKSEKRSRNFATVVYPESAPANWMDKLDSYHVSALVSPCHDKDLNPSGELKKAHFHVLVMFEGVKNFETQVKPMFNEIGGVGTERINSVRGYARYLCHLDNPEKFQYEPSKIKSFGGADYYELTNLPTDDIKKLSEIFDYIQENEIYSLAELLSISKVHHPEWFALIVTSKCYIVDKFIKSLKWEEETGYVRKKPLEQTEV